MNEILLKKPTYQVMVGSVPVGGGSPIVVQSMTNTDTADVEKTVLGRFLSYGKPVLKLSESRLITKPLLMLFQALLKPYIKEIVMCRLWAIFILMGISLLQAYPECAKLLAKVSYQSR
jgi:(E)-4-hydroxy-3-methylbut-2-enyl-diphosphate synthase